MMRALKERGTKMMRLISAEQPKNSLENTKDVKVYYE